MKDQQKMKICSLAFAGLFVLSVVRATTITENFSTEPAQDGWQVFGNTNLFQWNSASNNLAVTWDSAQPNSYFYHPLGTILTKADDFSFAFDLQLNDITSGNEAGKTGPMEIVLGLQNFATATNALFQRGVYYPLYAPTGAVNVVEFDYFPAGDFPFYGHVDPTVSPTLISTNAAFASGFNTPFELPTNVTIHVVLNYTAANQTLSTTLTTNGVPLGQILDVTLDSSFDDIRVDTFSISSYSSYGDDYDSVLAHGTVDNIVVTVPPPPVQNLAGTLAGGVWDAQFTSRQYWQYTLERTTDFVSWTDVSPATPGAPGTLDLQDTNAPGDQALYRIRAERP